MLWYVLPLSEWQREQERDQERDRDWEPGSAKLDHPMQVDVEQILTAQNGRRGRERIETNTSNVRLHKKPQSMPNNGSTHTHARTHTHISKSEKKQALWSDPSAWALSRSKDS